MGVGQSCSQGQMCSPAPDPGPILTQGVGSVKDGPEVLLGHGGQRLDVGPGLRIHEKGFPNLARGLPIGAPRLLHDSAPDASTLWALMPPAPHL